MGDRTDVTDRQRVPKKPRPAPPPPPPPRSENQALPAAQSRKLLGKHYANKYRMNRRGG